MRVSELSDQIGGAHQQTLFLILIIRFNRWKARKFNGAGDSGGVNELMVCQAIHHKQLRAVDVIGHKSRVRSAAQKLGFATLCVDHISVGAIAFENTADIANVVKQAGKDYMGKIAG